MINEPFDLQKTVREFVQKIEREHGVLVHSISVDWLDVSQVARQRSLPRSVTIESSDYMP